ncbi:uncharacterized protein LOC130969052 isoform X1 [Arachis stenosperma]|uniref:uncharacterized protein LOC130969052 isoform X1 n=1 Tax=Arachis stenosperma TaxID=217475 RepID=UPI0025AD9C02|nr:uncharacterized protein LOC130969052 isoform X1 [Arachis stenosperma]
MMDTEDQRKTHTPGHESHGVHLCHKCGWPFPNPHPSAKHRRAHKKICGTIEGYKLCSSEEQSRSNGSDDGHGSDDDKKSPGPEVLNIGNKEKDDSGIGDKLNRSEDEVFSDAVADFSDSQGVKESLQEGSLDSSTSVERDGKDDPKFSGSSKDSDFNDAVESQLTFESKDGCQNQHTKILQGERVEEENLPELQDQLSGSTATPLADSIADLRAEESAVVHSKDIFGLSTESHPSKPEAVPDLLPENTVNAGENVTDCNMRSAVLDTISEGKDEVNLIVSDSTTFGLSSESRPEKAEAMPDVLPENDIQAGENVTDFSLTSAALDTNSKGKDKIRSDQDEDVIIAPSDAVVGETCEGGSKMAVKDAMNVGSSTVSDPHKAEVMPDVLPENKIYADENVRDCVFTSELGTSLKGKDEIKTDVEEVEIIVPSDTGVGENEDDSAISVRDAVNLDPQVAGGAVNLKEKDSAEFPSVLGQDDSPLGSNSVVITNASICDVQLESAHVQFSNSSDAQTLLEKEEENTNSNILPTSVDRTEVSPSQGEYEDLERVLSRDFSGLDLSDQNNEVTEENSFTFNPSQLTWKNYASPDGHVIDSLGIMNKELVKSEPVAEEMHIEEHTEVSPDKLTIEGSQMSEEIDLSLNERNESNMVHFSVEQGPVDVENSQQISLESISVPSLNESLGNKSFGAETSETSVISIDNTSHHEETKIIGVAVNGMDEGANLEDDLNQTDMLLEVNQSSDLSKNGHAGEIDKTTRDLCGEPASNQEKRPVISDYVIDEPTRKSMVIECKDIDPKSETQEDVREHEECNKSVGTSSESHPAQDEGLLLKATEDVGKHSSLPTINSEPAAQNDSSVKHDQGGQPGKEISGVSATPVQDQSGNDMVKHISSGIDASVYSSSRCDSLEANWGSVSVLSMQSDAHAIIDTETSPSTEVGKSNLINSNATSEKQPSGKSEMFEAPSFMTLVEPRDAASHKAPASEDQKGKNSSSSLQAGWFTSQTQVMNESQARNKNEEIIAKVTNWSTPKEHTPLKSLLGEAAHSHSPSSPKLEENLASRKNGKLPQNNGSGLTTVNSILGPESPSAQALINDAAKEWNSPARYPAEMKREKRKAKSRPYWIQLVCCSSVDLQRRQKTAI